MDAEAYGAKLFNYLGAGCAAVGIALAAETGVLDVLLNASTAMTSQQIAHRKQLKERYVRELLGSLVTAEVIQTNEESTLFHVPDPCKPVLKQMAQFCRLVPHIGQKLPAVKQCFPCDGPKGVPFDSIPEIYDIMKGYREIHQDTHVESDILSVVPWVRDKLENGIEVAEFGCATGTIICNLAARFPQSSFTGCDHAEDVLHLARKYADDNNLKNITFETHDLFNLSDDINNRFDWIFVDDVIHDLAYPDKALSGIHRALKPGGTFSMIDTCCRGNYAKNVGDMGSCYLLTAGLLVCLAESSCHDGSAQLGAAWQLQKAESYLNQAGFKILKSEASKDDEHVFHFACEK